MTQKIAVALIHGIGPREPHFGEAAAAAIKERCRDTCGDDVVVEPVNWSDLTESLEDKLWTQVHLGVELNWEVVRQFMVSILADAFAYQITDTDRKLYDQIHAAFAATLKRLGQQAGGEAPLCIVAYSLGSVIASNFIYDLQKPELIQPDVRNEMGDTPLDRGETLSLLYTFGSPLALWSLRHRDFGQPVQVPSPKLRDFYPGLAGMWVNYYDKDDAFAFPLKHLNPAYERAVEQDIQVNVGIPMLTHWNPLSHMGYWTSSHVLRAIAGAIMDTWRVIN